MQLNAYLNFNGNCEAAFNFYVRQLGGKIAAMHSFADSPMAEQCSPDWRNKVMHAQLVLDGQILMGSDGMKPGDVTGMKGFSMSLNVKDIAEAESVFQALSENATIQMPLQQTFWAQRFGMLTDQFGTPWMVNCE
ncbi:MAG: VOC family protein [Burkholderiales bacterium]|nr:VOC family protein [Burkholderiales bacterium]